MKIIHVFDKFWTYPEHVQNIIFIKHSAQTDGDQWFLLSANDYWS